MLEKRESGSNIIYPFILRLLGSLSSGEEQGNFGEEKSRFERIRVGKNIKL